MYTMYKDNCDYNQCSTEIKPALKMMDYMNPMLLSKYSKCT